MHRDLEAMMDLGGRDERVYRLGRLHIRVRSNSIEEIQQYLHPRHQTEGAAPADWRVTFVRSPASAVSPSLWKEQSPTYRGGRLRSGHYLGHHVGHPTLAVRLGARDEIYVGEEVAVLFWSFFLKYVLTIHHLSIGVLHIKAAAVALGDRALILAGRTRSGKTDLALALARQGTLIANTHCLVEDGRVDGVATAIRVRAGNAESLLPPTGLPDTRWEFWPVRVAAIAFLDRTAGAGEVYRLDPAQGVAVGQEFAGATNNWDLKEDVADFSGSLGSAAELFLRERRLLESLFAAAPCFIVGTRPGPDGFESSRRVLARLAERG